MERLKLVNLDKYLTDLEKFEFICSHIENGPETCKIFILEDNNSFPIYQFFFVSPKFCSFKFQGDNYRRKVCSKSKSIDFYREHGLRDSLRGLRFDYGFGSGFTEIGKEVWMSSFFKGCFYDFQKEEYIIDFAAK